MEPIDLEKLEACCEAFYVGTYEAQRSAHSVLLPLVNDPVSLPELQLILARSQNAHALIFAASGLLKLISTGWNRISDTHKDDTRKFALNYLYNHGPQLLRSSNILLQNLVRLLCRIVKLGWLESLQNQNITEQVRQFLQSSTPHWVVGLTIYAVLTEDMQPTAGSQLARFRRTAMSFRETALSEIFETAIQTLQQLNAGTVHCVDGTDERLLLKQVLQLTLNCLNFDFMGTAADDAGDDQSTVMIPHTWSIVRDEKIPKLFFDLYTASWTIPTHQPRVDSARLCLQCLVLVAAIRKSFFQKDDDRIHHVSQLIDGTSAIVQTGLGLQDNYCYHELCRLLGKINAANHLWETSQTKGFETWLENVFQFTMRSLENWKHSPNSKHYLVGLWSNMVGPLLYLKEKAPPSVFKYIKRITIAFIDSRMRIAEEVARFQMEGVDFDYEDPIANEVMRGEQLEVIQNLSRCNYPHTSIYVMDLFRNTRTAATEGRMTREEFQQKMTWLIYMMSSLINVTWLARAPRVLLLNGTGLIDGRLEESELEEEDMGYRLVGEMASLVFGLISETDKLESAPESLELAYLSFLEQFKEVYVGERAKQTMQAQVESFFATLGTSGTTDVLNLMVEKLFRNLEHRVNCVPVIKKTLQLFNQSVTGVSVVHAPDRLPYFVVSGRLLLQSPLVKNAIMDHQNPRFTFLSIPQYGKFRTSYYATLTKLMIMDMKEETTERFDQFMIPFQETFNKLEKSVALGPSVFDTPYHCELIQHLARDLRGILFSSTTPESYNMVFNWLVNRPKQPGASRIDIFIRAADTWWSDYRLMIPTLKLIVELAHNKAQRITFDSNSPNGIILFKVISTLLLTYGQRILGRSDFQDLYRQKYKGIACALEMFCNALSGGYTNFGVFEVYNDSILANSLALGLQLCLSISEEDLQAYIKALKPFYHFLEIAGQTFMEHVIRLNPEALAQLLRCLEDGMCSFESGVSMQCCATVDHLVYYVFTKRDATDELGDNIRRFLSEQPQSLRRILHLMFQLVISGEMSGTWGMARPLLGLILLHPDDFVQMQERIMLQQIPDRRQKVKGYFGDLMVGVEGNLTGRNKDIFTKNLYAFSQAMRSSCA